MYEHEWDRIRERDPEHSARYAQRWRDLAAEGRDLDGEARFVSALIAAGSRVLDAGCGTGRVGGYLAERGYVVTGVDLDDYLIAEARASFPSGEWLVGDLASFDFGGAQFDAIVCAGNVLAFLDPAARHPALRNIAEALHSEGRFVSGFGIGRGYDFDEYEEDLAEAGLAVAHRFSTWNLHPFVPGSDFLVCVSGAAETAGRSSTRSRRG